MNIIFTTNIEEDAITNTNFRKVLFTCPGAGGLQLALMSLKPKEDIGLEKHDDADQFIRVEKGNAVAEIGKDQNGPGDKQKYYLEDNSVIIIPKGTWHNITNTGTDELKLYTVYSKAQHEDKEIDVVKQDEKEHLNPVKQFGGGQVKVYKFKNDY